MDMNENFSNVKSEVKDKDKDKDKDAYLSILPTIEPDNIHKQYEVKLTKKDKRYKNPFYKNENKNEKEAKQVNDDGNSKVYIDKDIGQNYADPKDMTEVERNAFKFGYPPNMTMQDYINWLYLFKDEPELLTLEHMINFQKLLNGRNISSPPPPSKQIPPLTEKKYFDSQYYGNIDDLETTNSKKYLSSQDYRNDDIAVADNLNSTTNSLLPYNYNNEKYTDFSDNWDLYGKSGVILNPELWKKIDPRVLQGFVGPVVLKQDIKNTFNANI